MPIPPLLTLGFLVDAKAELEVDLLATRGGKGRASIRMAEQVRHLSEREEEGILAGGASWWRRPEPGWPPPAGRSHSVLGLNVQAPDLRTVGRLLPPGRPLWLSKATSGFWLLRDGVLHHLPAQAVLWT